MVPMTPEGSAGPVRLRAFAEDDLPFLDRLCTDPEVLGEFEWPGFTDPRARRRRCEHDGYISACSSAVAVVRQDGTVVGIVTWKPRGYPSGVTYEIGVGIGPEHRGQGFATAVLCAASMSAYWSTDYCAKTGVRRRDPAPAERRERLGAARVYPGRPARRASQPTRSAPSSIRQNRRIKPVPISRTPAENDYSAPGISGDPHDRAKQALVAEAVDRYGESRSMIQPLPPGR